VSFYSDIALLARIMAGTGRMASIYRRCQEKCCPSLSNICSVSALPN